MLTNYFFYEVQTGNGERGLNPHIALKALRINNRRRLHAFIYSQRGFFKSTVIKRTMSVYSPLKGGPLSVLPAIRHPPYRDMLHGTRGPNTLMMICKLISAIGHLACQRSWKIESECGQGNFVLKGFIGSGRGFGRNWYWGDHFLTWWE